MANPPTIFERTIQGYSQGFHVEHIATFRLETCTSDEITQEVFNRLPDFDQIPVTKNGNIIGVLERDERETDGVIENQMHKLDESVLVSAEEPLNNFLQILAKPPFYRLVIQGTHINGIVTRSDVLKLPVRLYGFALVTNLELLMNQVIQIELPNETWDKHITKSRYKKAKKQRDAAKASHLDLPLIEFAQFCDKRTILYKHLFSQNDFKTDLEDIENNLRNPLAHSTTFVKDADDMLKFINGIEKTIYWIEQLCQHLDQFPSKMDNQ